MSTNFSASLRALPGIPQAQTQQTEFTPVKFTPAQVPTKPDTGGVVNPATAPMQDFLEKQLNPNSPTYIGNKYIPSIQQAGRELRAQLAPFGDYEFKEGDLGTLTPDKKQSGQPGSLYRDSYHDARAQAAAAGMLYSRSADSAVGEAWARLSEAERNVLNQYSATVSNQISAMQSEFTGVHQALLSLYGQNVQYALENPILNEPQEEPASAAPGTPASEQKQWTGKSAPNLKTLAAAWGIPASQIEVRRMGDGGYIARPKGQFSQPAASPPPASPPAASPPPASKQKQWTGKSAPNLKTLAAAWGIPASQIEVRRMGGGGYIARPKGQFK